MPDPKKAARFEQVMMPHFDAAYNLARWLMRSPSDAEDVVQEAFLRAFQSFEDFRGVRESDARPWLFTIVRNACYSWLRKNRRQELLTEFDETAHSFSDAPSPETLQLRRADAQIIEAGLQALPAEFREALILREMEDLSYKEIAEVTGVAMGTVMSRLSRGRRQLHQHLTALTKQESAR